MDMVTWTWIFLGLVQWAQLPQECYTFHVQVTLGSPFLVRRKEHGLCIAWLIVYVWLCWRHFSKSQPIPAFCKSLARTDFGSSFGKQIHTRRRDRDLKQWQQDLNLQYSRVPFLPVESSDAISAAKTLATATRDLPWDQRSPGWCNWGVPPSHETFYDCHIWD